MRSMMCIYRTMLYLDIDTVYWLSLKLYSYLREKSLISNAYTEYMERSSAVGCTSDS